MILKKKTDVMEKLKININEYKYSFKIKNENFINKTTLESVNVFKNYNLKKFVAHINDNKHSRINYCNLVGNDRGYEPFGIAFNKILI
jgi:hypothetical protein